MTEVTGIHATSIMKKISREEFEKEVLEADKPVLVNLRSKERAFKNWTEAVMNVTKEHNELKVVEVDVAEYADIFEGYEAERKVYSTFDVEYLPALALYREGNFITTVSSWSKAKDEAPVRDYERQISMFLNKFVFYDPSEVKYNKNWD